MMRSCVRILAIALAAVILIPAASSATNGYFTHGIGMKSKGMGGLGVALPHDAMAGGDNPATMAFVGNRFDVGLDWFSRDRGGEIVDNGAPFFADGTYDANGEDSFWIPEIGTNWMFGDKASIGLVIYGNGGMNTSYTTPISLLGTSNAGVNLNQAFIVPTAAFKLNEAHSIGVGLNVAWQSFKATGLQNFDNEQNSSNPGKVTNNGDATSWGYGASIGWYGQITCSTAAGIVYKTRTYMSEFDEYSGLFAEQGDFDVPPSIWGGFVVTPNEQFFWGIDLGYIWYSSIKSVGNPLLPNATQAQLGADDGPGFGWENAPVVRLGAAYDVNAAFTVRAGYNYGKQPIPETETLFNMLAPGVVEHHATLGGTWRMKPSMELTFAWMYAFEKTVEGNGSIPDPYGGGEANIHMSQSSFGLAFGMQF
jgi:long-chain fatty acid transport protein